MVRTEIYRIGAIDERGTIVPPAVVRELGFGAHYLVDKPLRPIKRVRRNPNKQSTYGIFGDPHPRR